MTPLEINRRFEKACSTYFQGPRVSHVRNEHDTYSKQSVDILDSVSLRYVTLRFLLLSLFGPEEGEDIFLSKYHLSLIGLQGTTSHKIQIVITTTVKLLSFYTVIISINAIGICNENVICIIEGNNPIQ
jgi:hypothetical protein